MPESPSVLCCLFMAGCAIMLTPSGALKFTNTSGLVISKEEARISNCEMSADSIAASGEKGLKQLSQCQHLTQDQITAIRQIISSGNTSFGPPSTWTSSVLHQLNQLIPVQGHSILRSIPKDVLMPWLQNSGLSQSQLVHIMESLKSSRRKREADTCPNKELNSTKILNEDQINELADYTPEDLKLCLTKEHLMNNISAFSAYGFTDEQLAAVKSKLDEIFPEGYPPVVLSKLGLIDDLLTAENIKNWTINSPSKVKDFLGSLSREDLRTAVIQRYMESGGQIDGAFLNAVGPYVCLLNETELSMINEDKIKEAPRLDPSSCSSAIKDKLYPTAKRAFSPIHYNYPEYYARIRPFLGGAPGEDLRALSKNNVNMDIQTFVKLKSSSVKELNVENVKNLLGTNLKDLPAYQDTPFVQEWIQKQKQSDLDSLGLGLKGGLPEGFIVLKRRN